MLGHPTYYPRFGFVPAVRFGLTFGEMPPRDAFMAMELVPGALRRRERCGSLRAGVRLSELTRQLVE